ncbi:S1C family serine protease [Paenibacillus sp. GCM10027626]|uniref:S1C family serine protease n=1 Tax=Paenibacillus sp. GCM10027626 TaxID=3273411 RepID=UPI00363E7F85
MEDNKKNPYDDFFHRDNDGESKNEHNDESKQEQKPSYYYSYGPFKPGGSDAEQVGRVEKAEMTPPRQLRPFAPTQSSSGGWQSKEPRRTSFRSVFLSFMAGVLVVGGLMVASDRLNWFSGGQQLGSVPANTQPEGSRAIDKGEGSTVSNVADVVRPNNIAKIFEQSSPAVVKISNYVSQSRSRSSYNDDPFWRFFGNDDQQDSGQDSGKMILNGTGSGFFFESDGYILTNQHVIEGAEEIEVSVEGHDKPLKAKKLGESFDLDLAVLKVEGSGFPTLKIGSSDKISIGDWVVAIGNPVGFDHSITVGVLSAKERPISIPDQQGTRNYQHLLQTDASINPGNSGGPLLNLNGEVVGINTAVSSQAQGIGFAIPASTILENLESLKANKEIPKPFIGATLGDITPQVQKGLGLSSDEGAYVDRVIYKSPAYMADLRQYDVITGMDGTKYKTKEEIISAVKSKAIGDKATLNIIRNGKEMNLEVVIGNEKEFEEQIKSQSQQQQQQQQLQR